MSVHWVVPKADNAMSETTGIPHEAQDTADEKYAFEIHHSGALIIWLLPLEGHPLVTSAYGPGAWIKVSGRHKEVPRDRW
jgi:hypothetical protein